MPHSFLVPPDPTTDAVEELLASVGFPVVLKPRHGAGSRDTVLIEDAQQLRAFLADQSTFVTRSETSMVVEEFLVAASPPYSACFASYLSVESVVAGGNISHVAMTGRFAPAEPFRETGYFIPSDLSSSQTKDVLGVASRAIEALGVGVGFLHTEIKLTPGGPRVIEVNGRLGGGIPEMAALATGVDLYKLSLRVALGEKIVFDDLVPTHRVSYILSPQPPQWARRLVSVEGLDQLAEHPGVETIHLNRHPGDDVDWRKGNYQYIFSVLGVASDHKGVLAVQQLIDEQVTMTYA